MKIKVVLLSLFCCSAFAAQQKLEAKVTKLLGFEPARADYAQRSLQAQNEMGIPPKKIVKTYRVSDKFLDDNAYATYSGIHLRQRALDKTFYGYQRFTLLHEAWHIKNKNSDILLDNLKKIGAGTFFAVVLIGSPVAAYNMIEVINKDICKKSEHRADMQAALALQCALCLQEKMRYPHFDKNVKKGYMSNAQLQPILDGYIQAKKICEYHTQLVMFRGF